MKYQGSNVVEDIVKRCKTMIKVFTIYNHFKSENKFKI